MVFFVCQGCEGAAASGVHGEGARQGDGEGKGRDDHLLGRVQGQQDPPVQGGGDFYSLISCNHQ